MKTIKRLLASLMVVIMLLTTAPMSGFAELDLMDIFDISASAKTYSGTCGDNLIWTLDIEAGNLVISGTGDMYNYDLNDLINDNHPWGNYVNRILTIIIYNGVTSIGDYAFENCYMLNNIIIPDSVTGIGSYAFEGCMSLASITIPDSITSIGDYAFSCCFSLTSVKIPNSVTSIGAWAFSDCDCLTSITISDSVTSIGDYTFSFCTRLTSVTIPDRVTSIGEGAFISCSKLTSVSIPDGVTSIGGSAFSSCYNLTDITIPDSVISISNSAFENCNSIADVYYDGTYEDWRKISIGLYNECLTKANIHFTSEPVTSTYTITFNGNGGSNIPASQTKTDGIDLILSKTIPTKSGYKFLGWATNKNATVAQYQPGSVFTKDADVTLYAVWSARNIYNIGEETYSFGNFGDSDSQGGHCFGMSMTSSGYYLDELDVTDIGINSSNELYTVSKTASVKKPICHYQDIQGYYAINATVAGGTYYKYEYYDINSDWNEVINYVKSHKYDDTGELQIGYRKDDQGGHAINFLRYENVNGQDRIYVYDNNFPDTETYFCKDTNGKIFQKPYSTFNGAIDCIALRNVYRYFDLAEGFDASRVIYAKADTIKIEGVTAYPMELGESEEYMMYEIPAEVETIIIEPLGDYATFEYMEEIYEFGAVNDETYGVFTLSTNEEAKDESFKIEKAEKGKVHSVSVDDFSMNYKGTVTISPEIDVDFGVGYMVTYSSSDPSVAYVDDDGYVIALSTGNATITCTLSDEFGNTVTDTCNVEVKYSWWQWIIVIVLFGWIWY